MARKLPASFAGKVLLIVNVASKCGLTPQYEQLEDLQKQFAAEGFSVLGSPATSSSAEPGSEERLRPSAALPTASPSRCLAKLTSTANIARRSIKTDCRRAESGGPGRQRFYERMASKGRAPLYVDDILWNFEKFLIDRRATSFSASLRI